IAVGQEHHDARRIGKARRVPPAIGNSLDQRRGVVIGRWRSEQRPPSDHTLSANATGTLPPRERGATAAAVDDHVADDRRWLCAAGDTRSPRTGLATDVAQ